MTIDPKILDEVAAQISDKEGWLSPERFHDCAYGADHYDSVDMDDVKRFREIARVAIETYEKLKPSPWRPIEEFDGTKTKFALIKWRDEQVNSRMFYEYSYAKYEDTSIWRLSPETRIIGATPTHFMLIPKRTGE